MEFFHWLALPEKDNITRWGDLIQAQRPSAKTFRDLPVWQKAHEFVLAVYIVTRNRSRSEIYGLVQHVTNSPLFSNPNTDINSSNFGRITNTLADTNRVIVVGVRFNF
jgi:23S rRNA-intervening sequence protein